VEGSFDTSDALRRAGLAAFASIELGRLLPPQTRSTHCPPLRSSAAANSRGLALTPFTRTRRTHPPRRAASRGCDAATPGLGVFAIAEAPSSLRGGRRVSGAGRRPSFFSARRAPPRGRTENAPRRADRAVPHPVVVNLKVCCALGDVPHTSPEMRIRHESCIKNSDASSLVRHSQINE